MKSYVVKVLNAFYITHDVKCFVVEKPEGYQFIPGQATEVAVNRPECLNLRRPFTFTCLQSQPYLEFMIKIYNDHKGVTNLLGGINTGAELVLHEVFGAIQYKGPGVFLAGGAGITPFISIFRDLYVKKQLQGNRLIYSNKTSDDVIMGKELRKMLKDNFINIITRENIIGYTGKRIDRHFLIENIVNFDQHFYICGTADFVKSISGHLIELGVNANSLVIEE
jgi:ferredoxin-NADP reductase